MSFCALCDQLRDLTHAWPWYEEPLFEGSPLLERGGYHRICAECHELLETEQLLRDLGMMYYRHDGPSKGNYVNPPAPPPLVEFHISRAVFVNHAGWEIRNVHDLLRYEILKPDDVQSILQIVQRKQGDFPDLGRYAVTTEMGTANSSEIRVAIHRRW